MRDRTVAETPAPAKLAGSGYGVGGQLFAGMDLPTGEAGQIDEGQLDPLL
ncbi:hypothetical protein [Streptomyces atratus]|nr:hypothetical protein [Streptomyces atratus]MCX5342945.1 hypothetical protein [Streptomyces atratus]